MGLRRGFKTEAAGLAKEIRLELGLGPFARLDPHELARHLDIPVLALSELEESAPDAVRYFLSTEPEAFSAVTVFRGHHRAVVHNDAHSEPRQNSNLTHELAHGLLLHEPAPRARQDDRMSELQLHQRRRSKLAHRRTARHRRNGPRSGPRTVHTPGRGASA